MTSKQDFKDKIFCVGIICYSYIVGTRVHGTKKFLVSFCMKIGSWSRPYMKVKTAFTFLFNTFLFRIMSTNATVAVHLDLLYATQFPTTLVKVDIKKDRSIVYARYNFTHMHR